MDFIRSATKSATIIASIPDYGLKSMRWLRWMAALVAACFVGGASAQGWMPSRPVALVVGAAPGGSIDLTARLLQRTMDQKRLVPAPVIVINKPGAGQGIAWAYMIEKGADGLALAMGGPSLVSNPVLGTHAIGYRDVTTVAMLFDDYTAFVVRADSPLKSMRDVIERLRRDPGALSIGCAPALGSGAHMGAVMGLRAGGVNAKDVRFVVYKAAGEAMTAAVGGEIDIASGTVANFPPHMQSGRIRVIGVTSPRRLGGAMAGVATLKEQGIDGVYTNWRSVIGPKVMAREYITYWEKVISAVVKSDEWQADLERNFWTANFLTGAAARQYVEQQGELFRQVFLELGMAKQAAK
jgi:putative tricarboxylic transport membrane protein